MQDLIDRVLNRDIRAIAKLISFIENDEKESINFLKKIYSYGNYAYYIGVTGPPGVGKSTLVDKLIKTVRGENHTCAVLCVDPTSPFTGGAILGDRIRMQEHFTDEGVFIRSMATRGSLGGLAKKASDCAKVLSAAGYDYIIFETVGTGQVEVDITEASDTTLVVLQPGTGDEIQTMKAGILEIADIFVINKKEKEGYERMLVELQMMIEFSGKSNGFPKIASTSAVLGEGIDVLWKYILEHKEYLKTSGMLYKRRKKRIKKELIRLVEHYMMSKFYKNGGEEKIEEAVNNIFSQKTDIYTEAENLCKT